MGAARAGAIAALLALLPAAGALAQALLPPESQLLGCLTPASYARGLPAYPERERLLRYGAAVRVELVFAHADQPPRLRWLDEADFADAPFRAAVAAHVRPWRVPCLPAGGEPGRLAFHFVFDPTDGRPRYGAAPSDAVQEAEQRKVDCLTAITQQRKPSYPDAEGRRGVEGTVLAWLRFTGPSEPPQVETLASPSPGLTRAIQGHASSFRMPCLRPGESGGVHISYVFRLEGSASTVLRDAPLTTFLQQVRDLPTPARFDTTTMGCPFQLQLTVLRPHLPNRVRQVGSFDAARLPLTDWLSRMTLDLDRKTANAVLGDSTVIDVPCAKIDL